MEATSSEDAGRMADRAAGIEQQLIELVHRRDTGDVAPGGAAELEAEIVALQEALGEIAERLPEERSPRPPG